MQNISLLPADTFVVVNKTILNNEDRKILTMLYQPIIGSSAISLYFTLWSYLGLNDFSSIDIMHQQLANNMASDLINIVHDRKKLEAIGLLKTYVKKASINSYIYQLYSPISVDEFFNTSVLGQLFLNSVGNKEYERIVNYFKIPELSFNNYENITSSFNETFEYVNISPAEDIVSSLKKKKSNNINLDSVDIDAILEFIPDDLLNKKGITNEIRETINMISNIYRFSEEALSSIIKSSINDLKAIDKEKLKTNARNYYQFENNGELPIIVYRKQPESLRTRNSLISKKSKMINVFETTSPYQFLKSKYKGANPSKSDLKIIEYLALDLKLNPGVINVLIDYVLKVNNNKLTKGYVETIAGQWKRNNILTVEEAMSLATSEYKNKKIRQGKGLKEVSKPNWVDKDIDRVTATKEEMDEIDNLLNSF